MSNLISIQGQIEKLQKQADVIRAKEFDQTVREILQKMHAFGIKFEDLKKPRSTVGKASTGRAKSMPTKSKLKLVGAVVPPKFIGPNGETWSGRGLTPRWLAAQLTGGRKKEDFAVSKAEVTSE